MREMALSRTARSARGNLASLCAVLLASLAASGAAGARNTFSAGDLGFTMEAPVDPAPGRTAYQVATFFLPASDGFAPNVKVLRQPFAGTIEEYYALADDPLIAANMREYGLTVVRREMKKGEVLGEYTGPVQGRQLHWYQRALKSGAHVYVITATATDSRWAATEKALVDSVDSFKLDAGAQAAPRAPGGAGEGDVASRSIAASYFEALTSGDTRTADRLVKAPFSLDRKKVLANAEEIASVHRSIAEKKGRREVPKYTIARTDLAPALDRVVFPKYVAYRVTVEGEHIDIYVSEDGPPKVIGFSD